MISAVYLIVLFLIGVTVNGAKDLPSYFPRCYRDDPKLNECLKNATEIVRPFLKKGVPEFGLPSISPFYIPEILLEQGTQSLNYKASLTNISVIGLDTYQFTAFEFDVKNLKFFGNVNLGMLHLEGNYSVEGKILVAPIAGNGRFYANITNSNGTLTQNAELVKNKKGVEYLRPYNTTITINVGDAEGRMDGLFDGNKVLAEATNNVIHDNIKDLVQEVKPAVEKVLTDIVHNLLQRTTARVPYDKLYPKSS